MNNLSAIELVLSTPECMPHVGSDYAAGMDLRLFLGINPREDFVVIKPGEKVLLGTGVRVAIPKGLVGLIIPRSSVGHKRGIIISNTVGVIDSDYRGEIKLSLKNTSSEDQVFYNYDRVCQMVVVPFLSPKAVKVVDSLEDTTRGSGGFGHSGIK